MGKNIVICCDGTGNEINTHLSNVLKLYRLLENTEDQIRYYDPGIGTMGDNNPWSKYLVSAKRIFGLATGRGLDENILDAYSFLVDNYEDGDKVYLFGFSRGAYTVSALAGFIYQIGLLSKDQTNIYQYALKAYRNVPFQVNEKNAWRFSRITGAKRIEVHFMGLWDTVSSIITPRRSSIFWSLQDLPHTSANPVVRTVRLASAVDEHRRMFRLHQWKPGQLFKPNPFVDDQEPQDFQQMWFSGVHSDVGGGYPEDESSIAKYPLEWMVSEAMSSGLRIDDYMFERLIKGEDRQNSKRKYIHANFLGIVHNSMTPLWKLLEYFPKRKKWLNWPSKKSFLGWYLPLQEPRHISKDQQLHSSVFKRMEALGKEYDPYNLRDFR